MATAPTTTATPAGNRTGNDARDGRTCEVRDWAVFVPGWWKNDLYTPDGLDRMAANFGLLSDPASAAFRRPDGGPFREALVKLGHSAAQRAKRSLGMPAFGRVVKVVRDKRDGWVRLWLDQVPARVGAWMNGGLIRSGSIELKPSVPHPKTPAETIPGPVLVAVGLLGEEAPGVPGVARPRAVFADGSPVPPDTDPTALMSAVGKASAEPDDVSDSYALAFSSEVEPVDEKAKQLQALGLTPEQIQQVMAIVGAAAGAAPATAADPNAPPAYFSAFEKRYADGCDEQKKVFADMGARLGAVEKFAEKAQADASADQTAAFSQEAGEVVDAAILRKIDGKYSPSVLKADRPRAVAEGVGLLAGDLKTFGAETDTPRQRFAAWKQRLLDGPGYDVNGTPIPDGNKPAGGLTPLQKQMLDSESMRRYAPQVRARLAAK